MDALKAMKNQTDEMLMKDLAMGHGYAFDRLYERYSDKIYGFTISKLRNNHGLAEDIHQMVWEKVYKKAHTFKTTEKFSSWIFRITKNTIIDELRKSSLRNKLIQSLEEESIFNRHKKISLSIPVKTLKSPYREILEMRYLKDMDIREIAKALNLKETNVRKVISRGLKKLKTIMEKS